MPNGIAATGFRTHLLGEVAAIEDLSIFQPLEESVPEESLMMLELYFEAFPSSESLESLNQACLDGGIPPWPGNSQIVFADSDRPIVYLAWTKGFAWISVIAGMVALTVLPMLLGGLLWWLIPEPVKDLLMMVVMMGGMFLMMKLIMPMLAPGKQKETTEEKAGAPKQ